MIIDKLSHSSMVVDKDRISSSFHSANSAPLEGSTSATTGRAREYDAMEGRRGRHGFEGMQGSMRAVGHKSPSMNRVIGLMIRWPRHRPALAPAEARPLDSPKVGDGVDNNA